MLIFPVPIITPFIGGISSGTSASRTEDIIEVLVAIVFLVAVVASAAVGVLTYLDIAGCIGPRDRSGACPWFGVFIQSVFTFVGVILVSLLGFGITTAVLRLRRAYREAYGTTTDIGDAS